MTTKNISSNQAATCPRATLLRELGFAWRRRLRGQAVRSWRETVTHFKPEPWLVALAHEKSRMPFKLRGLPEANK
jgi:hypothetical protein